MTQTAVTTSTQSAAVNMQPTVTLVAAYSIGLRWYEVLLDSQASICCFRGHRLLNNIGPALIPLRINGVGGSIRSDQVGTLPLFEGLTIYYSSEMMANVLCLAQVADMFRITWDQPRMAFIVHTADRAISFERRGDIFVADFRFMLTADFQESQQDEADGKHEGISAVTQSNYATTNAERSAVGGHDGRRAGRAHIRRPRRRILRRHCRGRL